MASFLPTISGSIAAVCLAVCLFACFLPPTCFISSTPSILHRINPSIHPLDMSSGYLRRNLKKPSISCVALHFIPATQQSSSHHRRASASQTATQLSSNFGDSIRSICLAGAIPGNLPSPSHGDGHRYLGICLPHQQHLTVAPVTWTPMNWVRPLDNWLWACSSKCAHDAFSRMDISLSTEVAG
ncbi:hypothetical protein BKA64DRAFT_108713 [Cadophora sp. MPI-SDFR-AT-0126]|nr:hypothetical protein BKA64DRAFT_108713 [Leotiomycetes sp. MPI-SDFR-AT-0126]